MPKKRKIPVEEPVVPPQDHRICGTICICQMTAILSSVAIVYLSVAIYFPSMRAFYSGIIEEPVMCTTSKVITVDKCNWGSCGEWCLSKTSGACVQIYVNLRQNGTSLKFDNCTNSFNKTCYGLDQDNVRKYRCKQEECKNLTGTFNCTSGICINITDAFECIFRDVDEPLNCTGNRGKINCMDISGLNTCRKGVCSRINEPYSCDRRCVDIPTRNKNVILISGDRVFLSQCQIVAVDVKSRLNDSLVENENASRADIGDASPVHGIWNDTQMTTLLASCYIVSNSRDRVQASDCVNATVVSRDTLSDLSNFTFLNNLVVLNDSHTSQEQMIAPVEMDLLIANDSRLMINLEGCVNTLREECKQFLKDYGRDGADHNARSRFPCFYAKKDPSMVVARFSLEVAYKEFLPAIVVPSILLVVSCFTLILCQKTVEVGDDAKMRFKKRRGGAILVNTDETPINERPRQANKKGAANTADTISDKGGGCCPDSSSVNL